MKAFDQHPRPRRNARRKHRAPGRRAGGFSLAELLISLLIVSILLGIGAYVFQRTVRSNILAQARNNLLTYVKVARAYAMANNIETMLVVNPYNGRFELWHLNPPADGGPFDPFSSGLNPPQTDGYAFANVLDPSARLPLNARGVPAAAVNPIDYNDDVYRPTVDDPEEKNLDNLTWTAVCFAADGQLVVRTRRIATRTYTRRDGTLRMPASARNRLLDETPDLSLSSIVTADDAPITSTRGVVISEFTPMAESLRGAALNPVNLINRWLLRTRPGQPFEAFATTIVLNRFTGQVEQQAGAQ